jgi:hypothetical protein
VIDDGGRHDTHTEAEGHHGDDALVARHFCIDVGSDPLVAKPLITALGPALFGEDQRQALPVRFALGEPLTLLGALRGR